MANDIAPAKTVRLTLVKSPLGYSYKHKATVRALGFRKVYQTVEHADTPQLRGMIYKVAHLLKVEEA